MKLKLFVVFVFSMIIMSCSSGRVQTKVKYHKRPKIYRTSPERHTKKNSKKKTATSKKERTTKKTKIKKSSTLADKVIWSAFKYKGVKYRYGGTTMKGVDCSGLVMNSFKERGILLPRSSYGMSQKGHKVSLKKARRGDLIFFYTNSRKPGRVTHVGLVTHIIDGVVQFIHASTKRGVVTNKMNQRYYKKNFAFVKRVL